MQIPTIFLSALLVLPSLVSAFPVKADTLNCRASPSTSAKIIKTYSKGQDVTITCQTTGPNISGTTVWDKTSDDCYVSDYYIKTGHASFIPGMKRCTGGGGDTGSNPGTTPAGVNFPKNKCKPYVVKHGNEILKQFPGFIHTVWCYANKPGEHGQGRALDFMHTPHAAKGKQLAEHVMNNYKKYQVMYVIWEQRIWNVGRDKTPKPWAQWRKMEDRGGCTANHCDHVHVSFN